MVKVQTLMSWCMLAVTSLAGQPEVAPWSNIRGIRLDGELMELNSTLGLVGNDWTDIRKTTKERAGYSYQRNGTVQFTPIRLDSFFYDQSVEDLGAGKANVRIPFRNEKDTQMIGAFFMLGYEFVMFSFNESDLGIDVRQTPEEHARFIKGLGAHLQKRGLKIKLLLGDTSDANGWPFIKAAMDDPDAHQYIGAVSFHSWRGYTDENLQQWTDAAESMQLPLLAGEGSMDAGAWRYPDIFSEPTYAMEEMNLYTRILRICQPESILQWQLTSDYSPLEGGGVFGNHEIPLRPTQRFWNFKQMANLPADLKYMPVSTDKKNVECSGFVDPERGIYVIHLVNNGTTRPATLRGLPSDIEWIKIRVSNEKSNYAARLPVRVREGTAQFEAEANSFITLLADGESGF